MAQAKKAVAPAKKQTTALAKSSPKGGDLALTSKQRLLQESAGLGMENMGAKDLAIPRISILQSGSPQVKKSEGAYIKGAEEGDFYDSATNTVLAKGSEGFHVIIVSYRRTYIEWVPKNAGGGFVADHGPDDNIMSLTTKDEKTGQYLLKNGHQVVLTAEYLVLYFTDEDTEPRQAVISLASTQLKHSRKLNTSTKMLMVDLGNGKQNPPAWWSYFNVTTVPESNDKGSWMAWHFERGGDTLDLEDGETTFAMAKAFHSAIQSGAVKVAPPAGDSEQLEPDDSAL